MASLKQWDTDWFDRFKRIYATNISMMALYPTDALSWIRIADEPYGIKQVERPMRNPDQNVQIAKNEEFTKPKYAASQVIKLDMPFIGDELRIKEEYYAGDTANALGHVADLNENYKQAIMSFAWLGSDTDPYMYGIVEDTASTSTTIEQPGHTDTASALSTSGQWDVYENMATDLALMDTSLENAGFFGPRAILAPPIFRPFLSRYMVEYTASPYTTVMGYPVYYNPYVDSGATSAAAAIYMVDTSMFELHMTPIKARAFWSDEQESYVWRWKCRCVPVALPKWDGTDYVKAIVGFDVDLIT
jgi:hypothetical protein